MASLKRSRRKLSPALPKAPGRPWILLAGLALVSLAGWLRLQQAIFNWQWLLDFNAQPGPWYLVVSGAAWGAAGAAAVVFTLLRRRWSLNAALGLVVFCAASYWLDRLLLSQAENAQVNTVFMGVATLACLIYAWAVLWLQKETAL